MKDRLEMGDNHTGLEAHKDMLDAMIEGVAQHPPTSKGDASTLVSIHADYAKASGNVGSIPRPRNKKRLDNLQAMLMDKLGARLAFERTGTRLWEAVIERFDVSGGFEGGPTREELERIRDQERAHFKMLVAAVEALDGDPTAVTPSANLESVVGAGVNAALGDPRVNLSQALDAILVAELADNDQWATLTKLARTVGQEELAKRCQQAFDEEQEHLRKVRAWLEAAAAAG